MRESSGAFLNGALSVALVFVLALSSSLMPGVAVASNPNSSLSIVDAESEVKSSKLSLEEAQSELDRIEAECAAISQEIDDMQTQVDALAQDVLEAQQRVLDGREALASTARHGYKTGSSSAIIGMLLGSTSFSSLTQNMQYVSQIMDYQSDEIAEQKRLREELDSAIAVLNEQKSEQEAKLNSLEGKQAEAQEVVERASSQLESSTEKLNALKKQAEAIKVQQQLQASAASTASTASDSGSSSNGSSASQGSSSSGGGSGSSGTSASASGWKTGVASAYGGSSDPSTPGTTTANGSTVSDYSMGVAIPMSWPNYRSYFGRTVEIVYNGRTVYATVNDCGYMGGGSRSLDLQPGVFKAFGFQTCNSWGVRTVQYRFL